MTQHASELRGFLVVARQEGAEVGSLSAIRIDPAAKTVIGFEMRTRRLAGDVRYVDVGDVEVVGRDVLLVTSEEILRDVTDDEPAPGVSLKHLQGMWVTSTEGKHLGTLIDVDFAPGDWRIRELLLAEDRHLAVDPDQIKIGDEIIVPQEMAARIEESPEPRRGLLSRIFGHEAIQDTKDAVARAVGRGERDDPPVL